MENIHKLNFIKQDKLQRHLNEARLSFVYSNEWNRFQKDFKKNIIPKIIAKIKKIPQKPLISVIVPTYNTSEIMLKEMIESVRNQLYPEWELCIADDGSTQTHVQGVLQEYAKKDKRIKLYFSPENRGVSHVSNAAIKMAKGDFVVLLDHDDILEKQALFRIAESILEDDPDMVYSDEVLVSSDASAIVQYVYRPAFSSEFLRGHPYIVHLVSYKKSLLENIGGFNEELRISQDYDLILRASEKAGIIVHIPEILYRWRIHRNSAGHKKKNQVVKTSVAILEKHLKRCGDKGIVRKGEFFNLFDIRYPLSNDIKVAIIIPTKNHWKLLQKCIQSIEATVFGVKYDIVIVDNGSDDPDTKAYLSSISFESRVLFYKGRFNFSAINNWAVAKIGKNYSHYLFCNNDIEAIKSGWLERMLELGQRPAVGIVGAKLFYPDRKTIQHAGVCVGAFGRAEHYGKFLESPKHLNRTGYLYSLAINHEVSAVTGACLLIRKNTFEEISGFDETLEVGFGDVDLCLRAGTLGHKTLFCPFAELVHHESYTRGISKKDNHPKDTALFKSKWKKLLKLGDSFYSPNFSSDCTTWQIGFPLSLNFEIHRRIIRRDEDNKQRVYFS